MFPDDATAERWFERQRWDQTGMYCPLCGSTDRVKEAPKRKPVPYWCGACRKRFSVRTGTLMARSHVGYQNWAIAIYQHLTNLKGVSSMKLKNDLGVTQKTAWFMLHRIRDAYDYEPSLMDGPVEADETFVGGKEKNKHAHKKIPGAKGGVGKAIVVGVKDRETGEVRARVVNDRSRETLHGFIRKHIKADAKKYTDENVSYKGLLNHESVQHDLKKWVDGEAHTNGIESFWAMLKRIPRRLSPHVRSALAPLHPGVLGPSQPARQGHAGSDAGSRCGHGRQAAHVQGSREVKPFGD